MNKEQEELEDIALKLDQFSGISTYFADRFGVVGESKTKKNGRFFYYYFFGNNNLKGVKKETTKLKKKYGKYFDILDLNKKSFSKNNHVAWLQKYTLLNVSMIKIDDILNNYFYWEFGKKIIKRIKTKGFCKFTVDF